MCRHVPRVLPRRGMNSAATWGRHRGHIENGSPTPSERTGNDCGKNREGWERSLHEAILHFWLADAYLTQWAPESNKGLQCCRPLSGCVVLLTGIELVTY